MDITPSLAADRQVIQSYGPEGFRIGGAVYRHPVLVWPDHVERWEIADFSKLDLASFDRIITYEPKAEFILLGCGTKGIFLPPILKQALRDSSFGIDAMDTGAACRTFNIMLSEERPVVAALMVGQTPLNSISMASTISVCL
jgi:uncharacterized protein